MSHRLVVTLTWVRMSMEAASPSSPPVMWRRGPMRG